MEKKMIFLVFVHCCSAWVRVTAGLV